MHRELEAERNGDSTGTFVCTNPGTQKDPVTGLPCIVDQVVGRQLRQQFDMDNSVDYQFEPVWKFNTGPVFHTLLTGFEAIRQNTNTQRETASLPNIANVFAPITPEPPGSPIFQCDAKHSCDDDRLAATYLSAYATDQIDVTDRLKVRAGFRQDWWNTSLNPLITVPGRLTSNGVPIIGGQILAAQENPTSYNFGALYKLLPGVTPYAGISKSYLTNFNSENTQQGIGPAESASQYEGGVRFFTPDERYVFTTAVYRIQRNNVATTFTPAGAITPLVVYDGQKTDGIEATFNARVTDAWHFIANATDMNAFVTSAPQTSPPSAAIGHHPQGVPRYLANLWTTYDFTIAGIHGFPGRHRRELSGQEL